MAEFFGYWLLCFLCLPVLTYFCVKFGTWAYLLAKERFDQRNSDSLTPERKEEK